MTNVDRIGTDPPVGPSLGDSRARVLAVLQTAPEPMGVGRVAELIGLHPNTTRFHLDALIESGLVRRTSEERDTPGRPRSMYSATAAGQASGVRSYRLLAQILVDYLAAQAERPQQAALAAGEAWGRALAHHDGAGPVDAAAATTELLHTLAELGFAPEAGFGDGGDRQVIAHHCPFRELADGNSEVVCGVHLGIVRGVLAELDAPLRADQLEPLVEPNLCITHLSRG